MARLEDHTILITSTLYKEGFSGNSYIETSGQVITTLSDLHHLGATVNLHADDPGEERNQFFLSLGGWSGGAKLTLLDANTLHFEYQRPFPPAGTPGVSDYHSPKNVMTKKLQIRLIDQNRTAGRIKALTGIFLLTDIPKETCH